MYKIILAFRYLFKRRISHFSLAAVALCVFVVFVVITVLSGLTAEFKAKTHNSVGDCVISTKSLVGFGYYDEFIDVLENEQIVHAVSPVIKSYALLEVTAEPGQKDIFYKDKDYPKEIMGVEPAAHSRVTGFGQWLHYNKGNAENAFEPGYAPDFPGCVPGVGLFFERDSDGSYDIPEQLLRLKVAVSCFPLTAKGALAKAGAGAVNTKSFYFSDTSQSGVKGDWSRLYLPFDEAQKLCGMAGAKKRVNAIHIKFKPGITLQAGCARIKALWSDFAASKADAPQANLLKKVTVQSWRTYRREFVATAETQQMLMIIIFGMIGIITVFIVFVVFYMIVCHKSKDIGILKSVGVSSGNVLGLFLGFGFLVGAVGSTIGAVGGWRFLVHINQIEDWLFKHFEFQLFTRKMYAIGDIPNAIDLKVLASIIFSAIVACLLGALIPSWQAARLKPVDSLQVSQL